MNIPRTRIAVALESALARAPAVALLGPRQVGKTTLARQLAHALAAQRGGKIANVVYLDLEKAADLRRLDDPGAYLRGRAGGLTIIDEVHRVPTLFAELRGIIDERRAAGERAGQFLLLGSASLDLVNHASETLAGRISYLEMTPVSPDEANAAGIGLDRVWQRGGFPDSLTAASDALSLDWRQDFIRSYLERDVPMFAPRMPASTIGRLWTMLAHAQGTPLNSARLAQALGISSPMIGRYIDLLDDLLLVRRLQPWSGNLGKRLVKSPKIYVRDSGLVHALLDIGTHEALLGHPVAGASWEGLVVETLIAAAGPRATPLYYRTADGAEIDLVIERAGQPAFAIEIKRSSAPKPEAGFHRAVEDIKAERRLVVAPVDDRYPLKGGIEVMGLAEAVAQVRG
jgi:predicted AAA+ superfamily ATPase